MKMLGLIGGMSWESTVTYYQLINEAVKEKLGGLHSAKILLYSVDFAQIEQYQISGMWEQSAELLTDAAKSLEAAGADFIVICTNTMHKVAPQIQKALHIPILHIADATADVLLARGIRKTALLGTKYTMTQDFYKLRLMTHGIEVVIPNRQEIEIVNRVIYEELCVGIISEASRRKYCEIIDRLKQEADAEAVILGCTEIGLLIKPENSVLTVFDTTRIHAEAAVAEAPMDNNPFRSLLIMIKEQKTTLIVFRNTAF